jgi:hypothetical protein
VQSALYIALGLLVVAAVAMQVWMMRAGTGLLPESSRGLAVFLRMLNIVLVVGAIAVVAYVLWGR